MYAFSDAFGTACPEQLKKGYIVGTCRLRMTGVCLHPGRSGSRDIGDILQLSVSE